MILPVISSETRKFNPATDGTARQRRSQTGMGFTGGNGGSRGNDYPADHADTRGLDASESATIRNPWLQVSFPDPFGNSPRRLMGHRPSLTVASGWLRRQW